LEVPATRRICVLLGHDDNFFGLVCDRVTTLEQSKFRLFPVPACMRTRSLVVSELALMDEAVMSVTSAAALARFLNPPRLEASASLADLVLDEL
jgi:hypothetical protein